MTECGALSSQAKLPMCCYIWHKNVLLRFHLCMLDVCPRLWISVKKMHESASGVSVADVTANRPCPTSPKISFSETIEGVERRMFSLSYSEMRKCCRGPFNVLSAGALRAPRRCDGAFETPFLMAVVVMVVVSLYILIWLLLFSPALGHINFLHGRSKGGCTQVN